MTMQLTRRTLLALGAAAPLPLLLPGLAEAAPAVCALGGLAIGGHDPVGYFTQGDAVPGERSNALLWRGAMWLFSSDETMERFTRTPHAFAPRYGGYCAMSMAMGLLAPSDPSVFEIDKGHLYLMRSDVEREAWDSNIPAHIAEADSHWPALLRA